MSSSVVNAILTVVHLNLYEIDICNAKKLDFVTLDFHNNVDKVLVHLRHKMMQLHAFS